MCLSVHGFTVAFFVYFGPYAYVCSRTNGSTQGSDGPLQDKGTFSIIKLASCAFKYKTMLTSPDKICVHNNQTCVTFSMAKTSEHCQSFSENGTHAKVWTHWRFVLISNAFLPCVFDVFLFSATFISTPLRPNICLFLFLSYIIVTSLAPSSCSLTSSSANAIFGRKWFDVFNSQHEQVLIMS